MNFIPPDRRRGNRRDEAPKGLGLALLFGLVALFWFGAGLLIGNAACKATAPDTQPAQVNTTSPCGGKP